MTAGCSDEVILQKKEEVDLILSITLGDCSDPCTNFECLNGGTCVVIDSYAKCECSQPIYTGNHCQLGIAY